LRLTEKIHPLKHDFEIMLGPDNKIPRFVNSLVIFGKEITLVDSGVKSSIENIISYIRQNGRNPSEISALILSHSHPDHIGSAKKLKKLTGCKVLAHKAEKDWMEDLELQQKQRPVPGFTSLVDEPVRVDDFLEYDQILEFDEDLNRSLKSIQDNTNNETVISSWTSPVYEKEKLAGLLANAATYLKRFDDCVNEVYTGHENAPLEFCKKFINELKLPEFYINPIVDCAFRTHLK
jgi:mRNA degradation ribonuclease J1/J2